MMARLVRPLALLRARIRRWFAALLTPILYGVPTYG